MRHQILRGGVTATPITYLGVAYNSEASQQYVRVNVTALGLQEDDYLIMMGCLHGTQSGAMTIDAITGMTINTLATGHPDQMNYGFFHGRLGSTIPTFIEFNVPIGSEPIHAKVMAFRGVDTTTAMDVTPQASEDLNYTGTATPETLTPVTDQCAIVVTVLAGAGTNANQTGYQAYDTDYFSGDLYVTRMVGAVWTLDADTSLQSPGSAFATVTNSDMAQATYALRPA